MFRYCRTDGALVPAAGSISPHAFDFVYSGAPLKWGCNHLRCGTCGERLREFGGWASTVDSNDARLLALFQHGDIEAAARDGIVARDRTARLYLCRCLSWAIVATTPLDEPPDEYTRLPPWRCAGHTRLALPARLDGVAIDAASDWDAIARRALSGALATEEAGAAPWGSEWLNRVRALVEPDPLAERIVAAALGCASDDDPRTAVAALLFFSANPARAELDALISVYRKDRARFDGRENPGAAGHALTWWLLQAVGQRILAGAATAETLGFAREAALATGDKPGLLLHALEERDGAWVAAERDALRAANPDYDFSAA